MITWILFTILAGVILALIVEGMARPGGVYEYPFLVAAISLAFMLPELPGIIRDPYMPEGSVDKTIVFAILCIAMARFGWSTESHYSSPAWMFRESNLLGLATMYVCLGAFFYVKFSHLPSEIRLDTQMSGTPVMYLFFSRLLVYGFAITAICLVRKRSAWATALVIACGGFYFDRIVIAGRRADTAEFFLFVAMALWFCKGWLPPRAAVAGGILCTALVITSTGQYRSVSLSQDGLSWERVSQINVLENFEQLLDEGGAEMRNAVYSIHSADKHMTFDFGAFHWNVLVFNFVPAQLVGQATKQALVLPVPDRYVEMEWSPPTGSTETGLADAFGSYWYFGAFKFFIFSFVLSRVYGAARAGSTEAQLIYILSAVPALHTITHHTQVLVSAWVHMSVFLVPFLLLIRQPRESLGGAASATSL